MHECVRMCPCVHVPVSILYSVIGLTSLSDFCAGIWQAYGYSSSLITLQCVSVCNLMHLIWPAAQRIRKSTLPQWVHARASHVEVRVRMCEVSSEKENNKNLQRPIQMPEEKNIKLTCHNKFGILNPS